MANQQSTTMAIMGMFTILCSTSAMASSLLSAAPSSKFVVDMTSTKVFPHTFEESVGSGHASLTMRQDWREQLTRCAKDLGVKRTRFHGLMDDDFSISISESTDSYYNLDSMVDFHLSIGMEPLFEVSFTPSWLAQNTSQTVTHYKGITSPPKNLKAWGGVINRLGTHLATRYPDHSFMFEIWNEPNGGFFTPSDSDQQSAYFDLYNETALALRAASNKFQIGGPATAGCGSWTAALKNFTDINSIPLDFVSCHVYGGGGQEASVGIVSHVIGPLASTQRAAGGLPVAITEWSSSWMYTIDYHDEPASAPFIVDAVSQMDGLVNISSYWVFGDVFEEGGVLPSPFHGGFGLLTVSGTPKPAYRAFQLLHGAGNRRMSVTNVSGSTCDNSGVLATANDTHVRLFVYNHPPISSDPGYDCEISLELSTTLPSTTSKSKLKSTSTVPAMLCRIDQNNSNPKQQWKTMGSPVYPSVEQLDQLEQASSLVWTPVAVTRVDFESNSQASITIDVSANSLAVIDLPLSLSAL